MAKLYNNIVETIGNTPVVRLNKIGPKNVNIYGKLEYFNPLGSVKDRLAMGVIEDAERRGELKPGQTIVEATSGNTGIGLAMVCAQRGYPLVITMAESFSVERRKLMRYLGAKVVLTPASEKGSGMVAKAEELAKKHGWWQSKQFENPANADIHAKTTAVEILEDFSEIGLDYWVTGFGSGGTVNGVSRVLKEKSPNTKIIACEPDNAQLLGSGIPQARNADGSNAQSHPNFRPHLMQGWTPDFIPKLAEQAVHNGTIDGLIAVDGNFAMECSKNLAQQEGIFVGVTSGAALAAALEVAKTAPDGSNILVMMPDTGERYLSTPLFDWVATEMTDQEKEISKSTPNYRFDVSAAPAPAAEEKIELDASAIKDVDAMINDDNNPIVLFGLEWCEFCWSVKKMCAAYDIEFRSVNIDALEYQENNRGGKIRAALRDKTTWDTFPQIFINGEFIGGCTDIFDDCKDDKLQEKLAKLNIPYNVKANKDPYSFLPNWLHPR